MRKRNPENVGLPPRWRFRSGAYWFQVPPGQRDRWDGKQTFRLGSSLHEAHKVFSERVRHLETRTTMIGGLIEKYRLRVLPNLAPTTQASQLVQLRQLNSVFGAVAVEDIEPVHCYKYVEARTAKVSAKHEISLLKSIFQYAIGWGDLRVHTLKDVKIKPQTTARTRYVTDDEIKACLSHEDRSQFSTPVCQAYIKLKLLTGLRKSDILRLTVANVTDDGLLTDTSKNKGGLLFLWSDALHAAVEEAKAARPTQRTTLIFCNRRGESLVTEAGRTGTFDSMWVDFISRVKEKSGISHFTEHDLRGKVGSDAESDERAAQLLGHSTTAVTRKHYRRKMQIVKPAS
jgi:integrase